MKFDPDIGEKLTDRLKAEFPELPKGKSWIKYGKERIYFNDKHDDIDYGFYIEFKPSGIQLKDFMDDYWLEKLNIDSQEQFEMELEDIYYEETYPLDQQFPSTTIREIRKSRRFESVILKEMKDNYKLKPIFMDIDITIEKEKIEKIEKTDRTHGGEDIYRLTIERDALIEVTDYMEDREDEADRLFMEQMRQNVGTTISVGKSAVVKEDIVVEEGEERTCINCNSTFVYNSSGDYRDFCSPDCSKEYQQDR